MTWYFFLYTFDKTFSEDVFWFYNGVMRFRLLSDYVNPIVFDFWSKLQKSMLLDLAQKGVALNVTGDGQEICKFVQYFSPILKFFVTTDNFKTIRGSHPTNAFIQPYNHAQFSFRRTKSNLFAVWQCRLQCWILLLRNYPGGNKEGHCLHGRHQRHGVILSNDGYRMLYCRVSYIVSIRSFYYGIYLNLFYCFFHSSQKFFLSSFSFWCGHANNRPRRFVFVIFCHFKPLAHFFISQSNIHIGKRRLFLFKALLLIKLAYSIYLGKKKSTNTLESSVFITGNLTLLESLQYNTVLEL